VQSLIFELLHVVELSSHAASNDVANPDLPTWLLTLHTLFPIAEFNQFVDPII
jgi:hypothetical protein